MESTRSATAFLTGGDWNTSGTPTTTNADSCASCNPSGNHISNLQAYLAGTDPTDYNSQPPNTLPGAECFTNRYGLYGGTGISIAPWTAQGIFYEGDTVTISNSLGTTIEVYDFHSHSITNAAPPVTLSGLGLGHYFVEVNGTNGGVGDRAQFSVLPQGYTNQPHSYIGEMPSSAAAWSNRYARLAPGFSLTGTMWAQTADYNTCCPDGIVTASGTNDWLVFDLFVNDYPSNPDWFANAPIKVIQINTAHTTNTGWATPPVDMTNSLASWIHDVVTLYTNAVARYGTNVAYEILNEPNSVDLDFVEDPNTNDVTHSVLPAAMTVSATVEAIEFVCPACKVWAPAAMGYNSWACIVLTSAVVRPYYTNVGLLSFHDMAGYYNTVDNNCGQFMATDLSLELMAGLYPGKEFAVDEVHPYSPDALGKTNGWCADAGGGGSGRYDAPNWTWTWRTMCSRFWKDLVMWKAKGVSRVQVFLELCDSAGTLDNGYYGWGDTLGEQYDHEGRGPRPTVDGQAMISWWLENATPLTNWLSGSELYVADAYGNYTNGTPGLHFYEWQFANGATNTFVWADEQITVTTNFGVGLTDIFSNQWTGPVGKEPVIAWGWPEQ